jgi:guanylate kinase
MGRILLLGGPATGGKTTMREILPLPPLVTTTTREPRPNEVNSVHYYFTNRRMFLEDYHNGLIVEKNEFAGNLYGLSKLEIEKALNSDKDYSCILNVDGIKYVKENFKNIYAIYLGVSMEVMLERLKQRGSSTDIINGKIDEYIKDIDSSYQYLYDYRLRTDFVSESEAYNSITTKLRSWNFKF